MTGSSTTPQPEFSTVANPITMDPPVEVPPTTPVVVTIAQDAAFGNATPPSVSTVSLPQGNWAAVVLDVTGTEQGQQYDRLCEIFDGPTQIFLGVTPEPTAAGITWHIQKNITGYLPILSGTQTFSTSVDNYLSSVDTGIPTITATLLFYPAGGGFQAARPASLASPELAGSAINETGPSSPATMPQEPNQIVPLLPSGSHTTLNTINAGQTINATVTLPKNVTTATLDLYAVGQIGEEFWWSLEPAFREIEVSIDGEPAGVIWPFPYVYTGGVNPLIWQPVTGIHTLDIPSYRLDLTPFAGMLGGTHTIGLTVVNNTGYWLAGGSLLLTTGRAATTGGIISNSPAFPHSSTTTSADALGSANQPVTSESAATSYQISGSVTEGQQTYIDTLHEALQFGDDQTNIDPSCVTRCYQWVHGEETQSSTESLTGPGADTVRNDQLSWTIDAPNGYEQNSTGSDFFLPASVSQQLSNFADQQGGGLGSWRTTLTESIIGYGALGVNGSSVAITNGDTTGTVSYVTSGLSPGTDISYVRTVVARGGQVEQDSSNQLPPPGGPPGGSPAR